MGISPTRDGKRKRGRQQTQELQDKGSSLNVLLKNGERITIPKLEFFPIVKVVESGRGSHTLYAQWNNEAIGLSVHHSWFMYRMNDSVNNEDRMLFIKAVSPEFYDRFLKPAGKTSRELYESQAKKHAIAAIHSVWIQSKAWDKWILEIKKLAIVSQIMAL